jgi:hypothetical protein
MGLAVRDRVPRLRSHGQRPEQIVLRLLVIAELQACAGQVVVSAKAAALSPERRAAAIAARPLAAWSSQRPQR